MSVADALRRRIARERVARREAEALLEAKSRALYEANRQLAHQVAAETDAANRLRAIIDSVPRGIVVTNARGVIEVVNSIFATLFGHADETVGTAIEDVIAETARADYHHLVDRFISSGMSQPAVAELVGRRTDGETFPLELILNGVEMGERTMLVYVLHDLTERKAAEEDHERLRRDLEQASKLEAVGQLAGGIAHEINTPTQYVGNNLHFLSDGFADLLGLIGTLTKAVGTPDDALAKAIETADLDYLTDEIPTAIRQSIDGVDQVSRLVLAMKDFAHPSVREKAATDINEAIQTALTVSRSEWKRVAQVETDLDPSLTDVPCYPGQFNQVMLNLIVNAAHAVSDKVGDTGTQGEIRIATRRGADHAEIRITDTGVGIPADIRDRIFEPFFTTKAVGKGTGQGMAISRDIVVDKHGGTIAFDSTLGEGTTFILRLPLNDRPAPARAAS